MSARKVLAWQICTGCALTRELLVTLKEAQRLQALPLAEHEQHDGCYPHLGAKPGRWYTNGARWAPSQTFAGVDETPDERASHTDAHSDQDFHAECWSHHPDGTPCPVDRDSDDPAQSAAADAGRAADAPGPSCPPAFPSDGA